MELRQAKRRRGDRAQENMELNFAVPMVCGGRTKPKEENLDIKVRPDFFPAPRNYENGRMLNVWRLVPPAGAKSFPAYIPAQIMADYTEACLIREASPKASATLSRRCLQGVLRDFWAVKPGRLVDEIEEIKDKIDPLTWEAIDAVRKLGNIGAHMEKDVNLIIDVDPEEARLLTDLSETLFRDWYVAREERKNSMSKLIATVVQKKAAKTSS